MNSDDRPDASQSVPPVTLEAEMVILGAMLLSPTTAGSLVVARLTDKDFQHPAHQVIFREIAAMFSASRAVDLITLTHRLEEKDLLEAVGGPVYVSELVARVPTTANIGHYIDILADRRRS